MLWALGTEVGMRPEQWGHVGPQGLSYRPPTMKKEQPLVICPVNVFLV